MTPQQAITKQEEIVKRIDAILVDGHSWLIPYYRPTSIRNQILQYLQSQGVVFKVEEISDNLAQTASQIETYYADKVGISSERTNHVFKAFKEAGYVEAVPLIEER